VPFLCNVDHRWVVGVDVNTEANRNEGRKWHRDRRTSCGNNDPLSFHSLHHEYIADKSAPLRWTNVSRGIVRSADRLLAFTAITDLSAGWVDPWVGLGRVGSDWVDIFQFWWVVLGWVHCSKSTRKDYVDTFKARLDKTWLHGRPHIGANGVSWPPGKTHEKLKSENMQKEHFSVLKNAPFRSQIFTIFFASGGKGTLAPLTKILRTFLLGCTS